MWYKYFFFANSCLQTFVLFDAVHKFVFFKDLKYLFKEPVDLFLLLISASRLSIHTSDHFLFKYAYA